MAEEMTDEEVQSYKAPPSDVTDLLLGGWEQRLHNGIPTSEVRCKSQTSSSISVRLMGRAHEEEVMFAAHLVKLLNKGRGDAVGVSGESSLADHMRAALEEIHAHHEPDPSDRERSARNGALQVLKSLAARLDIPDPFSQPE